MNKNKYSAVNTRSKIKSKKGFKFVEKEFSINVKNMNTKRNIKKIFFMTHEYYERILKSGINIPSIDKFILKSNKIFCSMKYEGKNLVEKNLNHKNTKFFYSKLAAIFDIIKKAKKHQIKIDPHIKNFVINSSGKVYYVDIFPPYSKKYENLRALYFNTMEEKKICKKNFSFFNPSNLFYHFVSDLVKLDYNFIYKLDFFYKKLREVKAIKSSKSFFKKKVIQIMEIEKFRVKKKIYLI